MNNKIYHVLKREFGDSTHYSELPIVFEGFLDECKIYTHNQGFTLLCPITAHKSDEVLYFVYYSNNEDYELLIAK